MTTDTSTSDTPTWTAICAVDDILPNTGVCARVAEHHVAVFRVGSDQFYALDNVDPQSMASVLSRGLIGNLGERLVVASPMYKHHYDLTTGACVESEAHSVRAFAVRATAGQVWVAAA
ncbi:MAG: nitrite reductase small subunit [Pseudomonadota bacterium]|jgi:nitrite reductase (NADH) small subunit